jgi:hypothetical protein
MPISLNGSTGIQFPDSSLQAAAASPNVLKNRIINGDMRIDQRNNGASITPTSGQFCVDRWLADLTQASKYSTQRNAGAVTPPVGFSNYLGATSLSAYSVTSTDYFVLQQRIEGFNMADLDWGTANAKTVTLSFWVRSSLTGTFGGALLNDGNNQNYPFSYTISSANTWTQISITIQGPTSGTWLATNGTGIKVIFSLGTGTSYSLTAGAWTGSLALSATGATSVVGTNGATFYITGVQLEQNTSATPFERRMYGMELANCQRYYYRIYPNENARPLSTSGQAYSTTGFIVTCQFPVPMRSRPTALEQSGTATHYAVLGAGTNAIACNSLILYNAFTSTILSVVEGTVASGLVSGNATSLNTSVSTGSNAYLGWSAEL